MKETGYSLPKELLDSLECVEGFDRGSFVRVHGSPERVHSIRLNPYKLPELPPSFAPGAEPVPWSSFGFYLPERPAYIFDPLLHAGAYYVQEASGMFVEQAYRAVFGDSAPRRVLDLCAAPGGKSTLLQSLIPPESLLVSNEVIRGRVGILQENMMKWGAGNVIVANDDPREIGKLTDYFDLILIDVPCSGSGLFRREPEAIKEWSLDSVRSCSLRQQRILSDVWSALSRDGILIYSTCSYSEQEDEEILDWILAEFAAEAIRIPLEKDWQIVETMTGAGGYGYRFFPDKLKGEGLFLAALRKKDGGYFHFPRQRGAEISLPTRQEQEQLRPWIGSPDALTTFKQDEQIHCLPHLFMDELLFLRSHLHLKNAGVVVGRSAGRDFIPAHDLALSEWVGQELPSLTITREQAIQYLRKEEIGLSAEQAGQKGWALVRYAGHRLGWAKILSGRINNYYPKELRILKRD